MPRLRSALCVLASLVAFSGSPLNAQTDAPSQPKPPSGWTKKQAARAERYMVAAAHPLAVEAGVRILDAGGSAVDAAIAVQLVLNLVEPQASGFGGGAFMLVYDANRRAVRAYDGRETAPEAATPELFLKPDGKPMAFKEAVVGGRSAGVPGLPKLLELAHRRHGKLAWATLFEPAIAIAENGFPLSPRLHALLQEDYGLAHHPAAKAYFFGDDGKPKPAGTPLKNPEFARTLRAVAAGGADAYYTGEIARDIVAAVRDHPFNPGVMSAKDLAGYRVREVDALCSPYRGYRVCGMPPSSSGGIAVLQMLGILSRFDMSRVRPGSSEAVHLFSEAGRLAFADRNRYVADDRFVRVPVKGLLDRTYLSERAQLIRPEKSMGKAEAGTPQGADVTYRTDPVDEVAGTSHIAIADGEGNAVSMTTTIEAFFGSRLMVRGFLLNNQLTDFNFAPVENGVRVANAVEPGKRPRSSMAPTLVFDNEGRLHMVVGSPGGSLIINYVAKMLVAMLDWKMDLQSAIELPNFGSRNGPTEVEKGTEYEKLVATLKAMGHDVRVIDMTSGIHGIVRARGGWLGGADPRREGTAMGK